MNCIPERVCRPVSDYLCTWSAQGRWGLPPEVNLDPIAMRDRLNEAFLFGGEGLLRSIDPAVRGRLTVVLDDGWDVPAGSAPGKDLSVFGSLIVDEGKFPSCTGTPEERLCALSRRIRELGYEGLGLWVAVQIAGAPGDARFSDEEIYEYWAERARWCRAAGVRYWKCDWGRQAGDLRFRRLMTQAVRDHAPGLLIEHLYQISDPLDSELPRDGAFEKRLAFSLGSLKISDALRTYDVAVEFGAATTLQRVACLAGAGIPAPDEGNLGILNVEDLLYIAPGCGAAAGVMRVPLDNPPSRLSRSRQMTELARLMGWHRLVSPFSLHDLPFRQSDERLVSSYSFAPDFSGWPDMHGQTIVQSAPAAMSFGLPLPSARPDGEGNRPYLVSSRHPHTGAAALCALPCTLPGRLYHMPRCLLTQEGLCADAPVGLFGRAEGYSLRFDRPVDACRVLAQDPAGRECVDITRQTVRQDDLLLVPGEVIDRLCAPNQPDGDHSDPAAILWLR